MVVATNITLGNVHRLRGLKKSEKEHTDTLVSLVIDAKNWPKTMESVKEYLRGDIAVKWVQLSYVLRSEKTVSPSSDEPEMSFSSNEDDMSAQALVFEGDLKTVIFKIDMMKFWGLISVITRDLDCWTYVKL